MLKNTLKSSLRVAFFLAINASLTPAGHSQTLNPSPVARHNFTEAFPRLQQLPKWSGDFLLSWRTDTDSSDYNNNLTIHGRDGNVIRRLRLWFPDALSVKLWDAAASSSGSVSVVGFALSRSGSVAPFLALVPANSSSVKIVQMSPFEGRKVTWGQDDTIWVLGWQLGEGRSLSAAPPHAIVQHYDRNGALLSKHLEWPAIQCGRHPLFLSGGHSQITSSPDRIGIFLPGCSTWMELSAASGEVLGRWQFHFPANYNEKKALYGTVVMTPSNQVYLDAKVFYQQAVDRNRGYIGLLSLNRTTMTWEPVDMKEAKIALGNLVWLAGIDGDSFVYSVSNYDLVWLKTASP
jgi:hypothetical protein